MVNTNYPYGRKNKPLDLYLTLYTHTKRFQVDQRHKCENTFEKNPGDDRQSSLETIS